MIKKCGMSKHLTKSSQQDKAVHMCSITHHKGGRNDKVICGYHVAKTK